MKISTLLAQLRNNLRGKVIVVGVGNRYREDDAAGPKLIDCLKEINPEKENRFIDAGERPENVIDRLKQLLPDYVVIVDAADFGGKAGEVRVIKKEEIDSLTISTHTLPLSLFMELVEVEVGAKPLLLGIQVKSVGFSEELTPEVATTVQQLASFFANIT